MAKYIKSILGYGSDSSRNHPDGTCVDDQPLALEASKVSADFKKVNKVGSLGTIYTGKFMGEKCAVKVFNGGVVQKEALQKHDIASITQHHPNVVLVHGLWYGNPANVLPNKDPALVMELCSISLDAYLQERMDKGEIAVFRLEKKLDILSGVTSGMIYLHSKRIVHGDLRAKKVLLNFSGPSNDRKILAKVAGVHEMKLYNSDTVLRLEASVQRSSIMPPEVRVGGEDFELTEPVDLFSFGCLTAHVASCIYPVPNTKAGLTEFQKRAQFITGSHHHVFEPLMKRCLSEQPVARGTFEDVKKELSVHQSKYGGKQAQKLEEQIREMESRRGEIESLKREVDQLKKQVKTLQMDKEEIQRSKTAVERERDDLDTKRLQLERDKQVLEDEVKNAREQSFQSRLQDVEKAKASFGDFFEKYEEAKRESSRLEQEIVRHQKDAEQRDADVVNAVKKHSEIVTKYDQLWRENHELQERFTKVKMDLEGSQKSLDSVCKRNGTLDKEKQDAIQRCGQLQRDLESTQKSLDSVCKRNGTLDKEKQDALQRCGQLQRDLEGLKREKQAKEVALTERDDKLKTLKGTVLDLTNKGSTSAETINMLGSELENLKEQKRQADRDLSTVTATSTQTKKELEMVEGKLVVKEEELLQLYEVKRKMDRKVDEQANCIESLNSKLTTSQAAFGQLNEKYRSATAELEEKKTAMDTLQQSNEKLEDEKSVFKTKIQRLEGRLEGKKEDLSKKEKEYHVLMRQYNETQAKFEAGQELLPGMEEKIEGLEEEKMELEAEQKKITIQRDNSRRKVEELSEKVQRLEADLQEKKNAISKFEREVEKNRTSISTLEEQLKDAGDAKERYEAMLQAESSKALKAERSLTALKEKSEKLEKDKQDLLFQSQRNKWPEKLEKQKKVQSELHSANKLLEATLAELSQELQREKDEKQQILSKLDKSMATEEGTLRELASIKLKLKSTETSAEDSKVSLEKCSCELKAMTEEFNTQKQKLQAMETTLTSRMKEYNDSEDAQLALLTREEDLQLQLAEAKEAASTVQTLKEEVVEAKRKLVTIKTENTVLTKALEHKTSNALHMEEEICRLKASLSDQQMIRREKQMLQKGQRELQRERQEVHTEQAKLQAMQEYKELMQTQLEHLVHISAQEKEKLLHGLTQLHASSTILKTTLSSVGHGSEHIAQLAGRIVDVERSIQKLSDTTEQLGAALGKDQSNSHAMRSCIQGLDVKKRSQDMHQLRFRTATECTGDEALLQQLCYMATGIKQLLVSTDGGRFTLGSGDASVEFPPGAVEKETSVRYAIILHGPFVFPAGYKPGSVVVYLNMDGATLKKPVLLFLSHWCIREEGDDKDTLKFLRAPHTLEAGQQKYVFQEQEEQKVDFTTHTNVGVLKIQDPQCLHCVETTNEKVARYSAITFSQYIPSEETLLFRIQLMCDSREWNERMTCTLQQKDWEKTSTVVTQFQYASGQQQITACPKESNGPGWEAVIDGQQAIVEHRFLAPVGKSKDEVEQEVISGRFPPCILYKIVYNSPEEIRVRPALMKVYLHGADAPLSFSCRVKEETSAMPPVSPASSEPVFGAATSLSPMDTAPVNTRDILTALDHQLDAKWRHFGTFMGVDYPIMEAIQRDKGGSPEDCMLEMLSKWTSNQAGTGTLARTWQTVVEAVQHCGDGVLAQVITSKHGGHLPH